MAPPTNSAALISSLLGPTTNVNEIQALGGSYAKYVADFRTYNDLHWTEDGANWAQADFYDRAKIDYAWWQMTGDQTYLDRANAIALDYRTNYIEQDFNPVAHWAQMTGIALHYAVTGDEASRTAVGKVADNFAIPYYMDNLGDVNAEMDNRMQAKTLENFINAYKIGAPSEHGNNWGALLHTAVDEILSSQAADGGYHFASVAGNVKPYMVGMLNEQLIDYYTNVEHDPRIIDSVRSSLDYIWTHDWDPSSQSFRYVDHTFYNAAAGETEEATPTADLNNMVVEGFGWIYQMTGDETYRDRGELVFSGGVNGAWLSGGKQFNQEYTSSYRFIDFAHSHGALETSPTDPTPSPGTQTSPLSPASGGSADPGSPVMDPGAGAPTGQSTGGNLADKVRIVGDWQSNSLQGSDADELLIGRGGNDIMSGGAGHDTFLFRPRSGADTITDFDVTQDSLAIDHKMVPASVNSDASLSEYLLAHTADVGGSAVITFSSHASVTLSNVLKDSLVPSDIHLI